MFICIKFADENVNNLEKVQENLSNKPVPQINRKITQSYANKDAETKATIIWCLHSVMKHFSYRDAADSVSCFSMMFEDSPIAASMKLSKDKVGYTIVHGLAPYFRDQLRDKLKECDHIVVGFDESMNKVTKRQQMDVVVKYWNKSKNESETNYLSSVFLSSAKALDLKDGLIKAVGDTSLLNKIIQVSMDGPAVNFSMHKSLSLELSQQHPHNAVLLEIGSCGLHNIHGAFKAGIEALKWGIVEFLRFLFFLFENSPTRRGKYASDTLSTLFPLQFCSTRWVENQVVAQRAIEMLPHLDKWINIVREDKKNPLNDGNKCFQVVSNFVKDKMALPKLAFFKSTAALVEPFLVEFQSEDPLAPFLHSELTSLTTNIMRRVVKKDVLQTSTSVIKVDMKSDNLLPASKVDIGFATNAALKQSRVKASDDLVVKFLNDCKNGLVKMIKKIQERSPLRYNLTRYITCLDPILISEHTDLAQSRMDSCLEALQDKNKLICGSLADKIKTEYNDLLRHDSVMQSMKLYKREEKRLDTFWMEVTDIPRRECTNLKYFIKTILIISHGNAALERGFSVNKEAIVEHQTENSLIALRIIYDTVTKAGGLEKIPLTQQMLLNVRMAHSRYKEYCRNKVTEEQEKVKLQNEKKRKAEELRELEAKKKKFLQDAAAVENEINNLYKKSTL